MDDGHAIKRQRVHSEPQNRERTKVSQENSNEGLEDGGDCGLIFSASGLAEAEVGAGLLKQLSLRRFAVVRVAGEVADRLCELHTQAEEIFRTLSSSTVSCGQRFVPNKGLMG